MFVKNGEIQPTSVGDGVTRKILGMGGSLMMVEVTFEEGGVGSVHTHPHEQISYLAKGKMEFSLGDEKRIIEEGDSIYIPSNAPHGTVALADSVIVDIFSPIREDFLK